MSFKRKEPNIFFLSGRILLLLWPKKELVIMTGGQVNAGKFSYRPALKGRQTDALIFAWVSYSSSMLQKISECWPFPFQTNPFTCAQHPPRRDQSARKVIRAWNAAKITKLLTCTVKNHLCTFEDLRLTENDVPRFLMQILYALLVLQIMLFF
jgi:hypothetical protein